MASKNSNQDTDGLTWSTATLTLGAHGLDIRNGANDPRIMTKLQNARFADEDTVERRTGYDGVPLQDGYSFPPVGNNITPNGWLYGHGQTISEVGPLNQADFHHPVAGRGGLVFDFDGSNVVWTGDRLLVLRDGDTALGGSRFWWRRAVDNAGAPIDTSAELAQGIPAYLPLQTDSNPPNTAVAGAVNTCLTKTLRVTVDCANAGATGNVNAWVISRSNGAILNHAEISGASNAAFDVRVVNSGEIPVAVWLDTADHNIYWSHWTGSGWSAAAVIVGSVACFDLASVTGGFHLVYQTTGHVIKAIKYSGVATQTNPYAVNTTVITSGTTPAGDTIAVNVDPAGHVAVAWADNTSTYVNVYNADLTAWSFGGRKTIAVTGLGANGGISLCSRGLIGDGGTYEWLLYVSYDSGGYTTVIAQYRPIAGGAVFDATSTVRYKTQLASKAFRVGNEVFCWLYAVNAGTNFLLAGFFRPRVAGYADREEAVSKTDGVVPMVLPDPLSADNTKFSWARRINTGQNFQRGGDVRIGDIDFLPHPTVTAFGKSAYISGSAVKNWDGVSLADAGWQDFPLVASFTQGTGGSLTLVTTYNYRVYAVRYNAKGERFESAAVTSGTALTGSNNKLTLTISPTSCTSHDDVTLEVYRTVGNGTTFYLDGTVANSFAGTVSYVSSIADAVLITHAADPHAAGVGIPSELESFGPLGCAFLATAGDRLWGAGGQVPAGEVQFSKLWDQNFGAGFDDLASTQVVDTTGDAITSIAGFNDAIVVHETSRISIFGGSGPDNFGSGSFSVPEIRLSDGASTPYGTALVPAGLVYWGSDGPRLLQSNFSTSCICAPVRTLTNQFEPTGVHVDFVREEVVWYTADGTAFLWNYRIPPGRWAEWTGLRAAHGQDGVFVTPEGLVMIGSEDAGSDAGNYFEFVGSSGLMRPEEILSGSTLVRRAGIMGKYHGPHKLRFRVYYNGSPLWSEETVWSPSDKTWLSSVNDVAALTPAQVDALGPTDHSGSYATHKRLQREVCSFLRVEFSDMGSDGPTFTPFELVFELGSKPGLGRTPVNTFTDS